MKALISGNFFRTSATNFSYSSAGISIFFLSFFLGCSNIFAADNSGSSDAFKPSTVENNLGDGADKSFEPEVYADLSDSAVQGAVSFDGARAVCGLGISMQKYAASVKGKEDFTSTSLSTYAFTIGLEYAKSFKKGLLMSRCASVEISQRSKKKNSTGVA